MKSWVALATMFMFLSGYNRNTHLAEEPPNYEFNPTYFRSDFCNPKSSAGQTAPEEARMSAKSPETEDEVEGFGHSCGEAKGPAVPNMRAEWGLAGVRVYRRGHRHRDLERNGPGASRSMRDSGGTRTTSAPSKRTGSSQRKGGESGSRTTQRQEAICTYWHRTMCTKYEC